jgi:hypothetical protein
VEGTFYLTKDFHVQCYEGTHVVTMVCSVLSLIIFALGFPASIFGVLYRFKSSNGAKHMSFLLGKFICSADGCSTLHMRFQLVMLGSGALGGKL